MIYLSLSLLPLINEHLTIKFMYFLWSIQTSLRKKTFHVIWKHVQLKSYAFFFIPTFWLPWRMRWWVSGGAVMVKTALMSRPPSTKTRTCELTGARRSTTKQKGLSIAGKKGRKSDHRSIRKRTSLILTDARKCSSAEVSIQGTTIPGTHATYFDGDRRMRFECRVRLPHGAFVTVDID
jgi:hypothetical protein